MSSGSYLLARAGLLDGYRCTVHWENIEGFVERFPALDMTDALFVIDRDRFTCSGGAASLDLMLAFVEADHGRELAVTVADQFIHKDSRDDNNHQRMSLRLRLGASHPKLLAAAGLMEQHLEEPLTIHDIAGQMNFTVRQLQRLFRHHLGCTPNQYYLDARLARARRMLAQSSLSILQVAVACGFVSASHFSKTYRNRYGASPREGRDLTALRPR
ncbi:MAG: helix-turn-helix domain-containing protein [Desulfobulbaceae bacterium]|nr:helix-turn-helix domain-containing protein [Desulfobulbaceae bacterium]